MNAVGLVAQRLFEVFRRTVPTPAERLARQGRRARSTEDFSPSLGRFYEQAKELRKEYRLGILARARVAYTLQRDMIAAGYPAGMTRQVLFSMIVLAFVGKV